MSFWIAIYRFLRLVFFTALAIAIAAGIYFTLITQFREYRRLQNREDRIREEVRLEEERMTKYQRMQERLQTDPRFVERIAREELGYSKTNETVFRFVEPMPEKTRKP